MTLADMLRYGPVHIAAWHDGKFRCVWTPQNPDTKAALVHGIGIEDSPTYAIVAAARHATELGWKQP